LSAFSARNGAPRAYRLHYVGQDGHFTDVGLIEANDDGIAVLGARQVAGPRPMDLWDGGWKINAIQATPPERLRPL
jgi:hypothetical protein